MKLLYTLNERPPHGLTLLLALQHMLASIGGIVAVPLIVGASIGLPNTEIVSLINAALLASGIVTVAQCLGFGPIGIRLPVVMGSSFAFLGVAISIGNEGGVAAIMGSALIGSFVVIGASFYMDKVRKLFPTVVSGVVVTLIGLTILPVAMNWVGDSPANTEQFATLPKLFLALISLGIVVGVSVYCKGAVAASAIVIGLAGGYIVALSLGMVDLEQISSAAWIGGPEPFKYGFTFSASAIISMSLVYIVVIAEATGDFMALGNNCQTQVSGKDLKRGLLGDGLGSTLSSILTAMPLASFSQNVGIVGITGVASRYVVAATGGLLILGGLFPKLAAIAVTIPKPVLGGVGFVMFGMIAYAGIRMLIKAADTKRNALVICVGLASGLAVTFEPRLLQHLPHDLANFLHSGITTGTIMTVLLNLVLPKSSRAEEQEALAESQAQVELEMKEQAEEELHSNEQSEIQQATTEPDVQTASENPEPKTN
ncbi:MULTISPECIES: nucleobase:cation symporter-2 family protein [unclassified Vibrio]|uniref:nucleobase:cation symporter-2 family protein n=1 Tax=unclassified Vibrio TaxID=2614977 RepID=UPI000C859B08|nr:MULTISPECIES: nucleobase:cation symporter-2 family protein [unclassified Vibrio]PMI91133.1 xanthine permease [Vibrio sp. 10N.286.45.E10]PTP07617.1 xanthine permease [Vibrio sp. 10N.286.45.A3]PTQ24681.1 xanthine permease [Vibrio sp. 10N.286.46.E10]TKE79966.1 purine permease [Vibrio sp. F12]TKE88883.1 purine permease [Vibrio sp. F12]